MPKIFWRSLRSRILLLVVLTFLFLSAAAISLFTFLRNHHAETLSLTEHHLISVASNLAQNYADHRTADNSLLTIEPGPPPPPPPPAGAPPPPRPSAQREGPPGPKPDLLKEITAETLQREDGIEGGFYAARADVLVGYAFPTHEGPGAEKAMPERERPTIENLAREAVAANSIRTFRFEGPHDAVLFVAVPIHERTSGTSGPTEEVDRRRVAHGAASRNRRRTESPAPVWKYRVRHGCADDRVACSVRYNGDPERSKHRSRTLGFDGGRPTGSHSSDGRASTVRGVRSGAPRHRLTSTRLAGKDRERTDAGVSGTPQ